MRTKNLAKNEFMNRDKKGTAHPTVTRPDEKLGGSVTKKPRRTYHCMSRRGILQGPGSFEVTPGFNLGGDRAVGRRRLSWSPSDCTGALARGVLGEHRCAREEQGRVDIVLSRATPPRGRELHDRLVRHA